MNDENHRHFVYLIQCGENGPIKIGIANNVWSRLAALQTGNPIELKLLYYLAVSDVNAAYRIENLLHKRYNHRRVSGEWFNVQIERIIWDLQFAASIAPWLSDALLCDGDEVFEEQETPSPAEHPTPIPSISSRSVYPNDRLPGSPRSTSPLMPRNRLPGANPFKSDHVQSAKLKDGTKRKESNDGTE